MNYEPTQRGRIHLERGRTIIESTTEIAACLLDNWDIVDSVLDKKWNILREKEGTFRMISSGSSVKYWRRVGVDAKFEIVESKKNVDSGYVKILLTFSRKFFSDRLALVIIRYSALTKESFSASGEFDIEKKGIVRFIGEARLHKLVDICTDELCKAATFMSKNLEEAKKKLSDRQLKILEEHLYRASHKGRLLIPEGLLQIIPLKDSSLVRLEAQFPKPFTVREEVNTGSEIQKILEEVREIILFSNSFARGSGDDRNGSASAQETGFHSRIMSIGRSLYSTYIKGDY